MSKEDDLFFRLTNEIPPVVEAAYARWKQASDSGNIADEVQRIVKQRSYDIQHVKQSDDKRTSFDAKSNAQKSKQVPDQHGIQCPVCLGVMGLSKVCPNCKEGQIGLMYKYTCSCGVVMYSRDKL